MAGDELFKRYLEIGQSVLGMTRERAESIVRDLVASGEVAKGQATKAADWLVERGRAGTEELAEIVRREIREQVTALGLATKEDVARLEAEIADLRSGQEPAPSPPPPSGAGATKSAGISRSGSVRKGTKAGGAADPTASSEPGAAPPPGGADSPKG